MLGALLSLVASAQEAPAAVVTEVHRSEVEVVTPYAEVLSKPAPVYARCVVRVVIEADGVPRSATPKADCAEPLATDAAEAALRGRWRLKEGQTAPLAFLVPVDARPLGRPDYLAMSTPELPESAETPEYTCEGFVGLSAEGRADFVQFTTGECPEAARAEVIHALAQRVSVPYLVDGVPTPVLDEFEYSMHEPDPQPRKIGPDGVVVRHEELRVRHRVTPKYPDAAFALYGPGDTVDCKIRIYVDGEGEPYDLQFLGCPYVFHDATRAAIMKWRWRPAKVDGEIVKAQFLLNVKYKQGY